MKPLLALAAALLACGEGGPVPRADRPQCDAGNGGISLPAGFSAAVFADEVGAARHVVVGPDGIVYVALEPPDRTSAGTSRSRVPGGIPGIALRGDWLYSRR